MGFNKFPQIRAKPVVGVGRRVVVSVTVVVHVPEISGRVSGSHPNVDRYRQSPYKPKMDSITFDQTDTT